VVAPRRSPAATFSPLRRMRSLMAITRLAKLRTQSTLPGVARARHFLLAGAPTTRKRRGPPLYFAHLPHITPVRFCAWRAAHALIAHQYRIVIDIAPERVPNLWFVISVSYLTTYRVRRHIFFCCAGRQHRHRNISHHGIARSRKRRLPHHHRSFNIISAATLRYTSPRTRYRHINAYGISPCAALCRLLLSAAIVLAPRVRSNNIASAAYYRTAGA